ncbi:MAG: energy-coupling factor transporter ATPase [Clostridia bacterium]|nr:energy-coupling factor transporter ATPase [Clostridia bacterium]
MNFFCYNLHGIRKLKEIFMPEPTSENVIQFENVKFSYAGAEGVFAVNGVNLEVRRGEFLSVIGHNGSGKSTLARLVNGLLEADSGKITVLGMGVSEGKNSLEIRRHVGIVFQNPDNQMVASIVEDDVAFGPENIGVEREEIGRRIEWALKAVGMEQYREATPTRLSGGQKQRIAIAGVLAIKPEILILDESTAMLDPKGRREVMEVVSRLNKDEGMTVILITHFMEEALLADRCVVMNRGEIVLTGTPEEIFENGEKLEAYNLSLPRISEIINDLTLGGMNLSNVLRPEELAKEIAQNFKDKGIENAESPADKIADSASQHLWDVSVKNLTFTYSKKSPFATKALKGINLRIDDGEFFGIIGHTGSGKSTLVQHLNALIKLPQAQKRYRAKKPKKGKPVPELPQITVGEFDLANKKTDFKALRASVGMVFQYPEYQLFAETVFADVAFGLKNFKKDLSKEEIEKAVRDSIEVVGLNYNEVKDKSPFDLSGGQKRRAAIAGVIVTRPSVLILDEPAAGLDPLGKKEIMELLHKLHREWCNTVIIVSHDMDEVAENCTKAAVISNGEVVACDRPCNLFKDSESLFALGLDIPLTSKICEELKKYGITINCDCTPKDFAAKVLKAYGGGNA